MDFDSAGRIVAVARPVSDPAVTLDQLVRIATTGETEILADIENVVVEGIAFSQGIDGPGMLVGTGELVAADPTVLNSAQLFSIEVPEVPLPQGATVIPSMLSAPGETIDTFGLGSFEELPGQGRLLFGIDQLETGLNPPGNAVIRGSAVALPVDPETGVSQVAALEAADFRPSTGSPEDGLLYFVAMSGADQNLLSDRLYTLDVDRFNRSAIQNSMVDVRALGLSEIAVHSIAWERHLDSAGQPTASLSTLSTVASPIGLMQNIHRLNPTFGTGFPTLGGISEFVSGDQVFLTDMTAIEFPDDDPLIEDPFILATTDGNNPRLLRIRRFDDPLTGDGAGGVISFGSLRDFDDTQTPRRGGNIQGLAWDPLFLNPFTGTRGALLGTDVTTDDLLLVDHRPRFPSADIFMIYVSQAEPNASISIARLSGAADDDPDADTDPDEEATDGVLEPIVQTGEVITISPDGENTQTFGAEAGGVILGTRTEFAGEDVPGFVPITQGIIDSQFGTRPQSFDDRPDLSTANIAAGLRVVGSLLEFYDGGLGLSNTLRQNLDAVTELAVSADGQEIVALDLDGIGPDGGRIFDLNGDGFALGGEPTLGAQLGRINPFTGRVGEQSDVIDIVDAITGLPLRNLVGLDFGDADLDVTTGAFDSGEDLYSIAVVDAPTPIDRSGEGIGGVLGDLGGTIRGLTATPGGITYAILERPATPLELVEISRDPLGGINTVTILGEIMGLNDSNAFEDIENINTLEIDENGQLRFIGNYLTDPNQRIFTLSPTVIPGGGPGLDLDPSDEVFAPSSIVLDFDPDPLVDNFTTDPFQVLAQHSEDGLFVIQDDGGPGTTFIVYELDPFTGVLTEVAGATNGDGQIFVAGVAAVISAGDIDRNDTFLAIDRSAPAGDGRIIAVDLFDPALSRALTGVSSIAADLNGFSNDLNNLNLAIAENGIGTDDELFVSEGGNLTLGTIDLTTELFTAVGTIRDAAGNELTGASALAFSPGEGSIPGQQGLYLLDAAEQLWEVNPAAGPNGGRLIDITGNPIADITASFQGNFLRRGAGPDNSFFTLDDQLVDIRSMDFDASGQLLAQVGLDGNLVNIDLTTRGQPFLTWGNVVNTEIGSLRPTVGSITYDTFNNRFLVVDNATGSARVENEGPGVESSILMVMNNWDNDSVLHQNMNKFHFAGAIFGHVDIFGAMNEFYVGWLLTGQGSEPGVLPIPEFPLIQDNFLIEGDLRSLIINANQDTLNEGGEDGGDDLSSGVDMQIGGRLGQYLAIDTSASGAIIEVENSDSAPFISLQKVPQHEIESRGSLIAGDPAAGDENLVDTEFRQHRLFFGDDRFSNDNPIQAQRLGTVASGIPGVPDSIQVFGETNLEGGLEDEVEEADPTTPLPTDFGDWYAVGLTAGQEITVTVDGLHDFIVFDPELRPIGFGSTGSFTGVRVPMRVRAVIPGEYFIQITDVFDLEGEDDVIEPGSGIDYLLRITDMEKRDELGALNSRANVGVGGVVTRGLVDGDPDAGVASNVDITLLRGDFGSVFAPGGIDGSINVAAGDLRSFDTFGAGTGTYVVSEDIGLFRALTQINGGTTGGGEEGDEDEEELLTSTLISAGADIQVIETAGPILPLTRIEAGGGLGSLRAGSVAPPFFDFTFDGIYVNSDGVGNDGIIDLIDVTGDWGVNGLGGMPILTGPGGNVRYMRVGGDLHQDASFFGTSSPPPGTTDIQLLPDEFLTFTDDGGGQITIANDSEDFVIDPALILAAELVPTIILPVPIVNVATYAMREGGVVVVKVEAGQSVDIHGDLVDPALSVEIGELEITGAVGGTDTTGTSDGVFGPNFITDEFGNVAVGAGFDLNGNVIPELDPQELSVDITGDGEVSIFHVEAPGINFSRIINHTGGDIPNLNIGSIVRLQTQGSIGFADARATLAPIGGAFGSLSLPFGSALVPDGSTDLTDGAPFPHFLPRLYIQTEHVIRMLAGEAIGNIEVVGHLVFAQTNTDLSRNPDLFEGIAAPLHVNGNLGTLNVGEGVLPSGAGARRAGIYVGGGVVVGSDGGGTVPGGVDVLTGNIDLIYNQGLLNPSAPPEVTGIADIRGDIHATSNINKIRLHNGSLINNFVAAAESTLGNPFLFEGRFDVLPDLDENILDIVLTGSASGIIGSHIIAPTVGDVTVRDGFGIFETIVDSIGVSGIGDFIADSYGFSRVEFIGGTQMGNLTALGTGLPQNVSDFSPSVRMVEQFAFDPFFDAPPSTFTDLYFHLPGIAIDDRGTPAFEDAFLNGRISEVSYQGARSMGLVTGHRIEELEISVGDSFTGIITRGAPVPFSIADSFLITGALGRFTPHAGITGTELSVAGPIRNIDIFGHVIDSAIRTDGPSGDIQNMRVRGNMDGILEVHGAVRRLQIDENLSGTVLIDGVAPNHTALQTFTLGGSMLDGSFMVIGNVTTMNINGSLGSQTPFDGLEDQMLIQGNLRTFNMGRGDVTAGGDVMALNMSVIGDLSRMLIDGLVTGDLTVTGKLTSYQITADAPQVGTALMSGSINVGDDLTTFMVRNGDVGDGIGSDVNITTGGTLRTFTVTGGSVNSDVTITSALENITTVRVTGGDMLGNLAAPNGAVQTVLVSGSDIGGNIDALYIRTLRADGDILTGANINIRDGVTSFLLGGDVQAGANVNIGAARSVNLRGALLGDLSLGPSGTSTTVTIGTDLGGNL
ncbi:MAG: hypothetical protein CMJ49_04760, partial [Planctomycetaceae bacterium]|nr:hypothetical protein [Planctomycetaceae bacterium]